MHKLEEKEKIEGLSPFYITNAENDKILLEIQGNHYQEQQEGTDNLAVLTEGSITQDGITVDIENGVASFSGVSTSDTTTYITVGTAYLYEGQTYYMNIDRQQSSGSSGFSIKNDTTIIWFTSGTEKAWECTKTGEYEIRISFAASTINEVGTFKALISKTSNATWVQGKKVIPSIEYPSSVETVKDSIKIIQCNSNFLKKQDAVENVTARGLTGQVLEDGTIILNGTTTGDTYVQLTDELKITDYYTSQNYVKHLLPVGNYKFISETSGQVSTNDIHAYIYGSSSATRLNIQRISESPKKEITFEFTNNENYYAYVWIKRGTTLTNFTMKFMLKRSDDNSEYVQNKQVEYDLEIQKAMLQNDKFDLENIKEIHNWGYINTKNVTNLAVSLNASSGDFRRYNVDLKINDRKSGEYLKIICTHFKNVASRWNEWEGICGWESGQTFCIGTFNPELNTADKMKNFLLNNNIEIYYELAETEELDLIEGQKEVLNNIKTFRGVNNIFFDNPIAKATITYTVELSDEIKQQFIQGPVYSKVKLKNNSIYNKIEGMSPFYITNAENDKILLEIQGNHYQEQQEGTDNLAVLTEGSITQDGITVDIENGVASFSGVSTSDTTTYITVGTAYLYEGQTYYMNIDRQQSSGSSGFSIKNDTTIIWFTSGTEKAWECTKTGEYEIRISFAASTINEVGTFKALISKTSNATWVQGKKVIPSIEYPSSVETVKDSIKIIQCNSNFLKKQDAVENVTARGLTGQVLEDGSIVLNGTTQYATYIQIASELKIGRYNDGLNFEKYILPRGDYKFSCQISGQASDTNISAFVRNSVSTSEFSKVLSRLPESEEKETQFEINNNEEYVAYVWINSGITLTNFTMKFMLKRSDDNSEYVQNKQKEYNLPIQQEMLDGDYFDLENNKEIHNYEKKNMSELDWQLSTNQLQEKTFDFVVMFSNEELLSTEINCFSNSFKSETASYLYNNDEERIGQSKSQIICRIGKEKVANIEEFKTLLAEKNAIVYVKKQSELDLTEEQKEILNSMQTFEGINNIFFDNPIAKAKLKYLPQIILTEADYIKSIKFYDTRFVPEEGIFGQTVMKQVDLEINNENQQLLLEDQEFELYLSTYYNEKEYNIKYGTFIVQKAEEENTNDNNEATCFDYMTKANQKYIDQVSYPCTMRELAENICEQLGLTLQTEKFRNDDFIVEDNQFVENETYRDVLKAIAMSAFSWARIDEHNVLRFDFNHNVEPIEELDYDQYYNLNKNEKMYGPVNKVVIGDSQIEGENVAVEDTESIATNGVHEVTILNNPFAYTQEKRIQLIEAGKELFGFTYLPINSMNTIGFIWLDCIDKISLKNMQDEVANTFVFDHTIEYDGTTLDEIASQALTETETKYTYTPETLKKLQRTEIVVDKQNQTITGIVEQTDGLNTQMTKVEQRVDGITQTVTDMGKDLNGKITETNSKIDQTAQSITLEVESVKEELDRKISQTNSKIDQTADSITAQVESVQKELDGKITETNSKIDQTAQSITLEVDNVKKDLDENYSTTEETDSKIEQTAENINLSVTESINNIQVGGTNLIPNSAPYNLDNWNNNNTTSIELTLSDEETAPFGKSIRIRTLNQPTAPGGVYIVPTTKVLEEGKEYCFSIWLRATAATVVTVGYARGGQTTFNVTTTYQKFTHKFTALAPTGSSHGFVVNIPAGTVPGRSVFFHSLKLEEGNKITAWSPAPSDDVKGSQIISSINISKEDIAINSDKVSLKGKAINLTSDDITINSTNFSVDKSGNMSCKNANVAGTITSTEGKIAGFDIASNKLSTSKFGFNTTGNTIMWIGDESPNTSFFLVTDNGHIYCNTNDPDVSENEVCRMVLTWGDYSTEILPHVIRITDAYNLPDAETIISTTGITTPRVIQTSLESIKKNISLYNENALEKVLNNDIYTYNLKSENDTDKKHIGFVIGDKYRTPKEVISKEGNAIELYSAIGILWKAVQEQQKKIEELENKIKEK